MPQSYFPLSLKEQSTPLLDIHNACGVPLRSHPDVRIEVLRMTWDADSTHFVLSGHLIHRPSEPLFISLATPSLTTLYSTTTDSVLNYSTTAIVSLDVLYPSHPTTTPFTIRIPPHVHNYYSFQGEGTFPVFAIVARVRGRALLNEGSVLRFAVPPPPPIESKATGKASRVLRSLDLTPSIELDYSALYVPANGRTPTLTGRVCIPTSTNTRVSPILRLFQDDVLHHSNNISSPPCKAKYDSAHIRWIGVPPSQDEDDEDDLISLAFAIDLPRVSAPSPGNSKEWVISLEQSGYDIRSTFSVVGALTKKPRRNAVAGVKKAKRQENEGVKKVKKMARQMGRFLFQSVRED